MNFRHFRRIIAFALILLQIGYRTADSHVPDNNNNPSAGLFGQLNIPTGLIGAVPAQSLLSGVNLDGRSQPLVSVGLGPHNGGYQSNGQSKQVQDLISQLSAALLSSLNNAAIPNGPSQRQNRSPSAFTNRQRDYAPPPYPSYPQGYAPYQPPSYPPYQPQQGYPQISPQAPPFQSYGGGPFQPPNQPYSYGAGYSPYGGYSPYAPSSPAGGSYGQPPNYGYGIPPPQQPPAPYPMSRSENQFGYGVNAGVYAGTYGSSSASATPDGGPPTSYGGLTPWTIINGYDDSDCGNGTPTNSTRARSNASGNGSVMPISIAEATADEASAPPAASATGDNATNSP